jgi:hypothetical protein
VAACTAAKQSGIEAATRYYHVSLPARIETEKQTLAQLTGWSMAHIDAMPNARKFQETPVAPQSEPSSTPWWEQLFKKSGKAS